VTASAQTFTFTARDPDGFADIYMVYFLVNPSPNIPTNTCHGFYNRIANAFYLYNDGLSSALGPITPGTSSSLQNSQCILYAASSSLVSASGTDLTITISIGLKSAFATTSQNVYLWIKDTQGHDTGWVQTSAWH
jgi:hypothetical protein